MSINLTVPQTMQELRPRITVIGVGGAGCNAVNNMINANLDGVDFLVANTDGQALAHSLAPRKIQLGTNLTAGLGAGSKPDIGRQAAEESMSEVIAELSDCNMVFITAGMGGGTGTGAAPVIAKAAREAGILTVGVVTKPFEFEGPRRMKQATTGIDQLAAHVDTLIVVPNQNLFHVTNERTTFADAFHMADEVLYQGVSGVTDLMLKPGIINLDFADIRSVMTEMGKAMMGTGEASGENRAIMAAETAINNPLLEDTSLLGAKALIINVTGGTELTFYEVDEAVQRIRREVDEDANLIFGSAIDDTLDGTIRVSVVATGIDANAMQAPLHRPSMNTTSAMPQATESVLSETPADVSDETMSNVKLPEEAAPAPILDAEMPDMAERMDSDVPVMMGDVPEQSLAEPTMSEDIAVSEPAEMVADADNAQIDLEDMVASIDSLAEESEQVEMASETADIVADKSEDDAFIPAAPVNIEQADIPAATAPIPESRPSLIRQISGLWRPRASEKEEAKVEEPVATPEEPAILNLSRGAALQETLPIGNQAPSTQEADDELDIPAFLRRQAN